MIFGSLQTLAAFVITLGILVSIHEFGHFWVARKCGVKVLKFSVGFGKPLWSWTDKLGTEFVIALIPLGGFVKMLDEREGPVAEAERHQSFNAKPVLSRIAIVAAGPIANFVLAVFALWLMYMVGIRTIMPQIGKVIPDSPAALAGLVPGDEIVSIDGEETPGWQQVNMELLSSIGDSRSLNFAVRSGEPGKVSTSAVREKNVEVNHWLVDSGISDPVRQLGLEPYSPVILPVLGELSPDGAAKKAGLQTGDRIVKANGQPVNDWMSFVQLIRANPKMALQVEFERDGQRVDIALVPGIREHDGQKLGYIGAGVESVDWPDFMVRKIQYNPLMALPKAAESTWSLTSMTVESLWKMVTGLVSVKNLSGPITIAKVAGASLQSGLENFLYFLAMLSVSLGVLNLLPIPVLDGGYLMFYFVELVRGKPVSERVQMFGLKIGVTFVVGLMMLALYNDLSRLF